MTGKPVPKARARVGVSEKGKHFAVTPERTKTWEQRIGWAFVSKYPQMMFGDKSLHMDVLVHRVADKKGSKEPKDIKGDVDNFIKSAMDGLQGVAFLNDRQVVSVLAKKYTVSDPAQECIIIRIQEV